MEKKILQQISTILEDLQYEIEELTIDKNGNTTNYIKEGIKELDSMINKSYKGI